VKAIIIHRKMLITRKCSSINPMRAQRIIEDLERTLTVNFTDKGAAKFFLKHANDIRYLIKPDDTYKHNLFNQINMLASCFSKL